MFITGVLLLGIVLIVAYFLLDRKDKKKVCQVPGIKASDPKTGNNDEIARAGSLHEFLKGLHQEHGSIASFYMGQDFMVSLASPELFKEVAKDFNRPEQVLKLFEPVWGHQSIAYANGQEWKKRRQIYDPAYSHKTVVEDHLPIFLEICDEMITELLKIPEDEHVKLEDKLVYFAVKNFCATSFGISFSKEAQLKAIKDCYHICWDHMEATIRVVHTQEEEEAFNKGREKFRALIHQVLEERQEVKDGTTLVDNQIKSGLPLDVVASDALTYLIAALHTTGLMLYWCMYYVSDRPDIQEKCFQEINQVLGNDTLDERAINDLKYLRQVLDESMRCSTLAPYAGRFRESDSVIGGYWIPAMTPIFQALGVTLEDADLWADPEKFDPDRFANPPNPYHFVPFGFAGRRKCPGYRFSYVEGLVFLSQFFKRFKVKLAPGQERDVRKVYGLVTNPDREILFTLIKRT